MALVEKSVLIGQSAERMFELVDRCEDYPLFLPWCSQTEVKYRDAQKTVATLHINYHSVKTAFTTENDKEHPHSMKILLGRWSFSPSGGCLALQDAGGECLQDRVSIALRFFQQGVR